MTQGVTQGVIYRQAVDAMVDVLLEQVPTHAEFLSQIIVADGKQAGQPMSVQGHPAQEAIVQAYDSGRYRRFAWAKPVQDGGTLIGLVPMFRRAIVERQTVVMAYPTGDSAKDIWTTKVWPVLAAFGGQDPQSGGGSRGGAARVVRLPSGGQFILRAAGGRGESGQASITGDALFVDEVEDWPDLHRLELIGQRINESVDPLAVYCCTVKRDRQPGQPDASLILMLVEEGSNGRLHYPCHACGLMQRLEWERVDLEAAAYRCECGAHWSEPQRLEALRRWSLVHERPRSDFFTLAWSALDSPRKGLHQLVKEYQRAIEFVDQGNHGPMRSFYRDRLTTGYTKDLEDADGAPARITCGYLAARSKASTYSINHGKEVHDEEGDSIHVSHKPEGVEFLTITEDVQQGGQRAPGRNYFLIQGWAADRRSWDLAWGHLVACPAGRSPSEPELHACLDRVHSLSEGIAKEIGSPLLKRGVDVGDRLPEIRRWLVRNPQWLAIRGVETNRKAMPGDLQGVIYKRQQEGGWTLYEIDVHEMRQRAQNGFLAPVGKPGAAHLPEGLTMQSSLIAHYCATALIADGKSGLRWSDRKEDRKHHPDWQKRHDLLDCRTYGCALAELQINDLTRRSSAPRRRYGAVGSL